MRKEKGDTNMAASEGPDRNRATDREPAEEEARKERKPELVIVDVGGYGCVVTDTSPGRGGDRIRKGKGMARCQQEAGQEGAGQEEEGDSLGTVPTLRHALFGPPPNKPRPLF
uniref:Cytoplasmic envelopment protein 3 n=1 Tax=Anatid alphaherpesvirus 2 TaxID=3080522 RepID=A0AAU0K7D2_9ALPH